MLSVFSALVLLVVPAVMAAPTSISALRNSNFRDLTRSLPQNCPLTGFTIPVPAGLTLSQGEVPILATVGRGTQNYTCTAGKYVSAGAVANLYDVSCLFAITKMFTPPAPVSNMLPQLALKGLQYPDNSGLPVAIHHFFVPSPGGTGISPEFASTNDKIIVKRDSGVDAVNPTVNVQYLKLTGLSGQGTFAKTVYRLDTANGQPPSSCSTEGESLAVQYSAMYYFTK